ncbi:hypothetical protein U472_11550 [Orenia metallireducens]|uniref:2,3-bisphosphoglycerate-dependent phosphoglycerate mutase n=1 Tax=Orenia metallireducens TaxID=1413210 RepID=A0A1C0A8P8_9FIRM|nr:histidine phosphatase family protein [Orenia metallireducens]OCL26612.1 hypothetical protein U472_11550 [Orenia metallireducens]
MKTNIYFVRHAESNYVPKDDDFYRPLSEKGKNDVKRVTDFFKDLNITRVLSSPYIRAVHTVEGVSKDKNLDMEIIEDFKERKVANRYLNDEEFRNFVKHQWNDFDYCLEGGESLNQVQERGIRALNKIIRKYHNENIIVGTHGTWLGVILNYFDEKYDYNFWKTIKMPDIVLLSFENENLKFIKQIEV